MTLKFKSGKLKWLRRIPLELIFWIAAFIVLAAADQPEGKEGLHFSLCPLSNLGADWCPGCGLGRSITQLFQGNLRESFEYHWFGIPAVLIISYRIVTLARYEWNNVKNIRKEK